MEPSTLPQALEISCDTWFYQLGEQFFARQQQGKLDIQHWAELFGFGRPTEVDIPGECERLSCRPPPGSSAAEHQDWYEGDSVNLSIGQGYLEATPLQLAVAYAALANGGTIVRPHLGEAVISDGRAQPRSPSRRCASSSCATWRRYARASTSQPTAPDGHLERRLRRLSDRRSTARRAPPRHRGGNDDSWYASWAPANDPKVVVVVLIENGGYGADAAAPAAREIYDAYFHLPG